MTHMWRCLAAVLIAAATFLSGPLRASEAAGPERILKSYLRAMYARDADVAYAFLSDADKAEKSLVEYRAETGSYDGPVLNVSRVLAEAIRFEKMAVSIEGDRATISFAARLPDANDPALEPLVQGFDKKRLNQLSSDELDRRLEQIATRSTTGQLPVILSNDERWELVRESEGWRVFVNWADTVEVRFNAVVMGDLGWEFTPVRNRVLAKPGETIEMAYRVRNTGTRETVGKARHIIGPRTQAGHLEIISCFCFLEQRLKPGESAELPLVFRVDFDVPETIRQFSVRYEFFPLTGFPEGAAG